MEQKDTLLLLCDGKERFTELPNHSETSIITHQVKVKRVKLDEGKDFKLFKDCE